MNNKQRKLVKELNIMVEQRRLIKDLNSMSRTLEKWEGKIPSKEYSSFGQKTLKGYISDIRVLINEAKKLIE